MRLSPKSPAQRGAGSAAALLLLLAGCAARPPGLGPLKATAPALPAGQARLWVYRDWLPSESLNLANVDVNGRYFGSVANGGAFYRDVPPGHYFIAPVSYNRDFDQNRDVILAAGQQAYVRIVSQQNWDGACRDCARDTFYARLSPPPGAAPQIAQRAAK